MSIRTTGSRIVYENRWMRVREDRIQRADGSPGVYGVIEKLDFALVVPVDEDGFYLVEQYRYPLRARSWEFPQGTWDDNPGADPLAVAHEELEAETGLRAGAMRRLGTIFSAPGLTTQGCHVFVGTALSHGDARLEPEEQDLQVHHVLFGGFPAMVAAGQITDAATLAAYGLLLLGAGIAFAGTQERPSAYGTAPALGDER